MSDPPERSLDRPKSTTIPDELLMSVINAVPHAVFVKDTEGRYILANTFAAGLLNMSVSELIGKTDADLFEPETAQRFTGTDRRVIHSGHSASYEEVGTARGQKRVYHTTKHPLLDSQGRVIGVVGFSEDITDRRKNEVDLKRHNEILQKIFDNIPIMISLVDANARFLFVNRHWERVLGWTRDETPKVDIWAEAFPDPGYREKVLQYLRDHPTGWTDFRLRVRDGQEIDTSWSMVVLSDGTRMNFGQDISERKRAEEHLRHSAEQLHALSARLLEVQEAERRHLARELHDEVGQQLTGLLFMLEAEDDITTDGARARLATARETVAGLLKRVRDLSFELRPAMLDHLGLLPALLWLFDRISAQTKLRIQFEHDGLDSRFPAPIETTVYRLVQEALTNVARHAGVEEVSVRVWRQEQGLHVQVEDEGRGFQPEAILASQATCGLTGMFERVQLNAGKLTLESAPGEGTQVQAWLPLS